MPAKGAKIQNVTFCNLKESHLTWKRHGDSNPSKAATVAAAAEHTAAEAEVSLIWVSNQNSSSR